MLVQWMGSLVAAAATPQGPLVVALEPTVGLDAPMPRRRAAVDRQQDAVLAAMPAGSVRVIRRHEVVFGLLVEADAQGLAALQADPRVRLVGPDAPGRGALDATIDYVGGTYTDDVGFDGAGQLVAVLDSGIDLAHPALTGRVVDEYCSCIPFEGNLGCCPGDVYDSEVPGVAQDVHGHGTHVTGIVASDGTVGGRGVAPAVDLLAVKVLDDNNAFAAASQVTFGLEWVLLNHPDVSVVNMSLGTLARFDTGCDQAASFTMTMAEAVDLLVAGGTVLMASSGNARDTLAIEAPSCLSGVMAVGNVHIQGNTLPNRAYDGCGSIVKPDDVVCSSNGGSLIEILAPGFRVESLGIGGGLTVFTGTSMASPHVAGAAAVLRSADPSLTVPQVRMQLTSTGQLVTDDRNGLTHPRLDLQAAVDAVADEDCENGVDDDADAIVDCDDPECATDPACGYVPKKPTGTTGATGDTGEPEVVDPTDPDEPEPLPIDCDGCVSSTEPAAGLTFGLTLLVGLRRRRG